MRVVTWGTFGVVLALAGCGGGDDATAADASAAPPPVVLGPENVAVVAQESLQSGPALSGALVPENSAQVRAEVAGPVVAVYAEEGQTVKRGDVLARIDDAALREALLGARAGMRSAESSAALARRNAERAQRLQAAGAIADRELEQTTQAATSAEGALADARARLVAAERQVSKATVRSPFAGVVAEQAANAGDVVAPGALLYTVVDPASMRLEGSVPASEIGKLSVGMPVDFRVTGYDRRFIGRVSRISPAADPATGQVRITVAIPNAGRDLVAGLFAEGRVATSSSVALAVPVSALDARGLSPSVLRLKSARVDRVPVQPGVRDEARERVEVRGALAAGDTVLLGTAQSISEGSVVRIRRDSAAAR
jgi:RND family efflux transporter MFP subunit